MGGKEKDNFCFDFWEEFSSGWWYMIYMLDMISGIKYTECFYIEITNKLSDKIKKTKQ